MLITEIQKPMPHTYQYPRPALTVDCVLFGFGEGDLQLLLIQRNFAKIDDFIISVSPIGKVMMRVTYLAHLVLLRIVLVVMIPARGAVAIATRVFGPS